MRDKALTGFCKTRYMEGKTQQKSRVTQKGNKQTKCPVLKEIGGRA